MINFHKEPISIRHSDLERSDASRYRSECPACEDGLLLVKRDERTGDLLKHDRCMSCAQLFIYSDLGR